MKNQKDKNSNRNPGFLIKMNLKVFIICVAAVMLLAGPALAEGTATIRGGVYSWDTFEPLENAVVRVNSTPSQSMVAKYGVYSFELDPGDYLITANYYKNSTLIYSAGESIEVKGEGNYVVDLLLLPVYSEELMDNSSEGREISENPESTENSSNIMQPVSNNSYDVNNSDVNNSSANVSVTETSKINGGFISSTVYYILAALVLSFLVAGGYSLKKRGSPGKNNPEKFILKKNQSGTSKLEKSGLEEKEEYDAERLSVPVSTPEYSAKEAVLENPHRVELKTKQKFSAESIETQLSDNPEFKARETEKQAESREGKFGSNLELTAFKQGTEDGNETFAEESSSEEMDLKEISLKLSEKEPEPEKLPEPETLIIKKNLSLPADLQQIMDIIRGQGGRITQKDLRSKLKYSEGKVSLMLADLERREQIEKFKRGRGNVIILRDDDR